MFDMTEIHRYLSRETALWLAQVDAGTAIPAGAVLVQQMTAQYVLLTIQVMGMMAEMIPSPER